MFAIIFALPLFGIDDTSSRLSNLLDNFQFTRFGIDDPWSQLYSVGGQQEVTSLSRHHSHVFSDMSSVSFGLLFNSIGFSYQRE
jgi:hypothetical protein